MDGQSWRRHIILHRLFAQLYRFRRGQARPARFRRPGLPRRCGPQETTAPRLWNCTTKRTACVSSPTRSTFRLNAAPRLKAERSSENRMSVWDARIGQIQIRHTSCRHSRAGGNPDLDSSEVLFEDCCNRKLLDSRLRGNDGNQTFKFSQAVYLRSSES